MNAYFNIPLAARGLRRIFPEGMEALPHRTSKPDI